MSDTDVTNIWTKLFIALAEAARGTDLFSVNIIPVQHLLGQLHLIQPFDWPNWRAPRLEPQEMWQQDIHNCIRHITRYVRADRFNEGVLGSAIRSGSIAILTLTAFTHTGGSVAPKLESLEVH